MATVHTGAGITADGCQTLQGWITDCGIAWGLDAADRARHGQPAEDANTWAFGLRRLLLGYAMPGDGSQTFAGAVPYDQIGEGEADLLGRFACFWERVTAWVVAARVAKPLSDWVDLAESWLATMVSADDDTAPLIDAVQERLAALREDGQRTNLTDPLDLATFRQLLDDRFTFSGVQPSLLTGRITVCSLSTVRHVPFRVVCLLGMDEAAFPRRVRQTSFDRVSASPRPGDRPADDEDRQLFLDAVLAARDHLLVTYTGFDARSNAALPMCLPVADLLDQLVETVACQQDWTEDDERVLALRDHILRTQPLQAFSPAAYGDGGTALPAFDGRLLDGARRLQAKLRQGEAGSEPVPLLSKALAPADGPPVLSVADLITFWRDPLQGLFRQRLDVDLSDPDTEGPEREPLFASRLDEYALGDRLLSWHDADIADPDALLRGFGRLPAGPQGSGIAERLRTVAAHLARAAAACGAVGAPAFHPVDRTVAGIRLVGTIGHVWPQARIEARFGSVQPHHLMATWIRHLVLHACDPHYQRPTCLIGRKDDLVRPPLILKPMTQAQAEQRLSVLLEWWQIGQTRPLLFFPKTSWAYAADYQEAVDAGKDDPHTAAISDLFRQWRGALKGPPKPYAESQSPYVLTLLEGEPRFVWDPGCVVPGYAEALPTFAELARTIWGPYLEDGHDQL
jgi:exodeoxyribonuclease V gamma subunit